MSTTLIISKGSVWAQSSICAEAEAARAAAEASTIEEQKKLRRRNLRAWANRGVHITNATAGMAGCKRGNPPSTSRVRNEIISVVMNHPQGICAADVRALVPLAHPATIPSMLNELTTLRVLKRETRDNPHHETQPLCPRVFFYTHNSEES
jgi:hypothetical protein